MTTSNQDTATRGAALIHRRRPVRQADIQQRAATLVQVTGDTWELVQLCPLTVSIAGTGSPHSAWTSNPLLGLRHAGICRNMSTCLRAAAGLRTDGGGFVLMLQFVREPVCGLGWCGPAEQSRDFLDRREHELLLLGLGRGAAAIIVIQVILHIHTLDCKLDVFFRVVILHHYHHQQHNTPKENCLT